MKNSKKFIYNNNDDYDMYLYFFYHHNVWKSLLKKGLNLRSLKFNNQWKYQIKIKENLDPCVIFLIGMLNISPIVLPLSLWVGGAKRTLAFPLFVKKQITLGKLLLIKFCKEKRRVNKKKLAEHLIESFYDVGGLWQKKKRVVWCLYRK